jgi:hypothetical protein
MEKVENGLIELIEAIGAQTAVMRELTTELRELKTEVQEQTKALTTKSITLDQQIAEQSNLLRRTIADKNIELNKTLAQQAIDLNKTLADQSIDLKLAIAGLGTSPKTTPASATFSAREGKVSAKKRNKETADDPESLYFAAIIVVTKRFGL